VPAILHPLEKNMELTLFGPRVFLRWMCNAVTRAQRNLEPERLIRQRLALKQIAGQLRVSLKTVRC
jgi:hypothetical protein